MLAAVLRGRRDHDRPGRRRRLRVVRRGDARRVDAVVSGAAGVARVGVLVEQPGRGSDTCTGLSQFGADAPGRRVLPQLDQPPAVRAAGVLSHRGRQPLLRDVVAGRDPEQAGRPRRSTSADSPDPRPPRSRRCVSAVYLPGARRVLQVAVDPPVGLRRHGVDVRECRASPPGSSLTM